MVLLSGPGKSCNDGHATSRGVASSLGNPCCVLCRVGWSGVGWAHQVATLLLAVLGNLLVRTGEGGVFRVLSLGEA